VGGYLLGFRHGAQNLKAALQRFANVEKGVEQLKKGQEGLKIGQSDVIAQQHWPEVAPRRFPKIWMAPIPADTMGTWRRW
jgi:hypothetical protein